MFLNDVTLREAAQMPGREYSIEQKVAAGTALDELGVEYLQAGFPITGETDRETIRRLAGTVNAEIVGLARSVADDVDAAIDAEADVIEVIIPLSDLQLEHVLGTTREVAVEMARSAVDRAHEAGAEVHVSIVDAFRTDLGHIRSFAAQFDDVAFLNLADTVGARTPASVRSFLYSLETTVDLERVGVHFHDDMGVATANALAAYDVGVGKVDVSVASLGERAGNPALEEVVVAAFLEHEDPLVEQVEQLIPVCETVIDELGESVEPRKAILGTEVTEHESGIHTAAMLHEPSVFEPFDPAKFGGSRRLLFGAGTGRTGARTLLERAGVDPSEERIEQLLADLEQNGPLDSAHAMSLIESRFS